MAANIEQELIAKVRALPPDKQEEALDYISALMAEIHEAAASTDRNLEKRPVWEVIEEMNRLSPPDTWDEVPTDGSANLDHYLYGAPKRQS
jgi:hypothetical protein